MFRNVLNAPSLALPPDRARSTRGRGWIFFKQDLKDQIPTLEAQSFGRAVALGHYFQEALLAQARAAGNQGQRVVGHVLESGKIWQGAGFCTKVFCQQRCLAVAKVVYPPDSWRGV